MKQTPTAAELDRWRAEMIDLKPAQVTALDALATGSTHAEAAELAGVARETVTRWLSHHPGFREALDRYRQALNAETTTAAIRIRGKALATVERHLDALAIVEHLDAAGFAAALKVLRAVPALEPGPPVADAGEALAAEVRRLAASVPAPPRRRNANGRIAAIDLDNFDYDVNAEHAEQAEAEALARLAEAAGVREA